MNIEYLRQIKKTCFDDIYKRSNYKDNMCVLFKPHNARQLEIIMSNGVQYAMIIADVGEIATLPEISISWQTFCQVCNLFTNEISYKKTEKEIIFLEKSVKLSCLEVKNDYNNNCNFNFVFDDVENTMLSCDNSFIVKQPDGSPYKCFVFKDDTLISTNGNYGTINKLDYNVSEDEIKMSSLPQGKWLYNKNSRIIVSEDRRIYCTYDKVDCSFPTKALLDISKTPLSNSFTCNAKDFLEAIKRASIVGDLIHIYFGDSCIELKSNNDTKTSKYSLKIVADYKNKTDREEIKLFKNPLLDFANCIDKNGDITFEFDDSSTQHFVRSSNDNLVYFGMGVL